MKKLIMWTPVLGFFYGRGFIDGGGDITGIIGESWFVVYANAIFQGITTGLFFGSIIVLSVYGLIKI